LVPSSRPDILDRLRILWTATPDQAPVSERAMSRQEVGRLLPSRHPEPSAGEPWPSTSRHCGSESKRWIDQSREPGITLIGTRVHQHGNDVTELTVVLQDGFGEIHVLHEKLAELISGMKHLDVDRLANVILSHAENVDSLTRVGRTETVVNHWRSPIQVVGRAADDGFAV
jgi:hypothetical protein